MLQDIKAVIFDMDGTIIDSMWVWHQVDIEFLKKYKRELPADLLKNIEGMSFTETASYFKKRFKLAQGIEDIKNEWVDMVRDYYSSVIEIKKGVKEFLNYLKENNYRIGMATSNFRDLVDVVLKRNNIYEYFESIVTTCEVSRDKTSPDVFLEAAKRLDVKPANCLVFEDSISGITGARAAGMKVTAIYDEYGACSADELKKAADNFIEDFESLVKKCNKSRPSQNEAL